MQRFFAVIIIVFLGFPFVARAAYTSDFMKGFNFPSWWYDSYSQKWADESFDALAKEQPTWIAIGPFWYQKDQYATTIYAHPTRTANDAGVRHMIQRAHAQGMKVMLKPLVDAENGVWRGQFKPKNTNAWFASYKKFILHYADIAQEEGVASLLIGGEYQTLSTPQYANAWRDIIRAVRERYSGTISYGANWGKKGSAEFEKINWWDALDFISIHGYFPVSTTNNATRADMMNGWQSVQFQGSEQHWFSQIKAVHDQYGKDVVFTEAGYKSCDGATRITWWCNPKAAVDLQEQSDGIASLLETWKDVSWFRGIFWWTWNIKPWAGGENDKDHNLNGKPALRVIREYWQPGTSVIVAPPTPVFVPTNEPDLPIKIDPEPVATSVVVPHARDITAPSAPTSVTIIQENNTLVLRWIDPEDADFASILIYRNHGGVTPVDGGNLYARVAAGVQTFIDIAVDVGNTYRYVVRSEDAVGNSDANVVIFSLVLRPPAPHILFPPPLPFGIAPVRSPSLRMLFAAEMPTRLLLFTAPDKPLRRGR